MPVVAALLGLLVGSFLNACIHRWPRRESVLTPRSRCPHCGATIAWHDNIPLLSYVVLRARCRTCEQQISPRYPLVELLAALLFAAVGARFGLDLASVKAALLGAICLTLFFTDLERFVLPDQATLGGLAAGIVFSAVVPLRAGLSHAILATAGWEVPGWGASLLESCLSAGLFAGLLYAVGEVYVRLRGVQGLGFGDVKLAAMIGAFLGSSGTLLVLLAACLSGSAVGILLLAAGRAERDSPLPLGSFLSASAALSPFLAQPILNAYWEFMLG